MKINSRGLDLIKASEGLRLQSYRCPAGIWTIGYGHTGIDVEPNQLIYVERAEALLAKDVERFEKGVGKRLKRVPTGNQFAAMVSLAYNIGLIAFGHSSVLRLFNQGKPARAALAFLLWVKVRNQRTNKLEVVQGLVNRRRAEQELFNAKGKCYGT